MLLFLDFMKKLTHGQNFEKKIESVAFAAIV